MAKTCQERPNHGEITKGLEHGDLVNRTLSFIYHSLPAWRDDPERATAINEEDFNGQLCDFLNSSRTPLCNMIHFRHEQPQASRRRVDIAVKPINKRVIIGSSFCKYSPYLVLEGKCLPPPSNRKKREKEYVTSGVEEKIGGGIQRFKLGLHGATLERAAIIGYVNSNTCLYWFNSINRWIHELYENPEKDLIACSKDEELSCYSADSINKTAKAESKHNRSEELSDIHITHLLIEIPIATY